MPKGLIICTLCQRVQRGRGWVDMGQVIRELRTYDFHEIPHLQGAICDDCAGSILSRRAAALEDIAA